MKARVELPPKLIPVFTGPARYRGAHGGRGSGKTRGFALMSAVRAYMFAESGVSGTILCAREFMNSLEDSSMEEVKQAIRETPWLSSYFEVGERYIRTRNRRVDYTFCGLRHNLDSIKSKARILIAWVDEAEGTSEVAWQKLLPTVRENDSEVWVTWNPELDGSPTDLRFRRSMPPECKIVELNYTDNPWFPSVLDLERKADYDRLDPQTYAWVWDGAYRENSDAQIFANKYRVSEFEPAADWDGPYYGLDFGFSQDPTAGVKLWINGRTLYVEYEAGGVEIENDDMAKLLIEELPGIEKHVVVADNARPELISHLKKRDPNGTRPNLPKIEPCSKGKGSVEDGISFMKSFTEIVIHARCKETQKEFRLYSYKVDRLSGDVMTDIVDKHNHCLPAGTTVATSRGEIPIESVVAGDYALTRNGYKLVTFAGITDINREIVEVVTSLGTVRCTPDHEIYVDGKGFVRADALSYTDGLVHNPEHQEWSKLRNTTATPIADIQNPKDALIGFISRATSMAGRSICTGRYGKTIRAISLPATTFTTRMKILAITPYLTLSASLRQNTVKSTLLRVKQEIACCSISKESGRLQKHGMPVKRGGKSTARLDQWLVIISCQSKRAACIAKKCFLRTNSAISTNTAQTLASPQQGEQLELITSQGSALHVDLSSCATDTLKPRTVLARVQTVRSVGVAEKVYDLTVEEDHEFFADGILVHNCIDAIRYALEKVRKRSTFAAA